MRKMLKGQSLPESTKYCSKCGTPVPQIIRIAKIKPDIDVAELFKNIQKKLKETNNLFERTLLVLRKAMLESRHLE